jgi:undecaprenyl-diphosphatase
MKKSRLFFLTCMVILFSLSGFSQNFDINLLKPINKNETPFKNKYLELNASASGRIAVAAPATVFIAGMIKHDPELKKDGMYMMGAYLASSIVAQSVKRITDRQRPFETYSFIVKRDDESGGLSFPSGHTASAFCTATSLSLYFPKWYVIAPSYLFAGSVAWARMYQGVHYPSDVLAGALVGAGSAWLSWKIQHWMDKKHKK